MNAVNNVYISRRFNCSIHDLFQWIVDADLIIQWFGPIHLKVVAVKTNLSIGEKFSIQFLKPDETTFSIEGQYLKIEKPNKLVFSFQYIGLTDAPPESIVEITLISIGEKVSELVLIQKFDVTPINMESRSNSWNMMFSKLSDRITNNV